MKNKEIEELLNNLNKKLENYELDKKFGQLSVDSIYHLFPNEIQLLLSHIRELENNRDKAIEIFGKSYNSNRNRRYIINHIKR